MKELENMSPNEFQENMFSIFRNLKNKIPDPRTSFSIPLLKEGKIIGVLEPVTVDDIKNRESIALLSDWRDKNAFWFPAQFKVTEERTKKWLKEQVIEKEDRILFWVKDDAGRKVGHLGFYRINPKDYSCEIDNVIRGVEDAPRGIMKEALSVLIQWSFTVVGNKALELIVFADNKIAIAFYEHCGFKVIKKIPLKRVADADGMHWESLSDSSTEAERYNLKMRIERN